MSSRRILCVEAFIFLVPSVLFLVLPGVVEGEVTKFVFTSDPQTVKPNIVSEQLSIQAQNSSGESVSIPQTGCLSLQSSSAHGQFSSNATNWNSITVLTMNKSTANKNFYYKDSTEGSPVLTVKVALKPEAGNRTCANWPVEEWGTTWTTTQTIPVSSSAQPAQNTQTSSSQTSQNSQTTKSSQTSSTSSSSDDLHVDAGGDRTVILGADVSFIVRASRGKTTVDNASFIWNFGDGSTGQGTAVLHRYEYAGRYTVVVVSSKDGDTGSHRFVVTAEAAQLSVRVLSDGSIEIENLSEHDIDLSRWTIQSAGQRFTLPENSLILGKETMHVSPNTLHFYAATSSELDYPSGVLAFAARQQVTQPAPPPAPPSATAEIPKPVPAQKTIVATKKTTKAPVYEEDDTDEVTQAKSEEVATSSQVAAAGESVSSSWKWWIAAIGITVLAGGAMVAAKRYGKKEWTFVDDSAE